MTADASPNKPDAELPTVLQTGLIGRRALLRAYEGASERCAEPRLKQKFSQFAEEERREYERAAEITRQHGGDPGVVHNVKEEVAAFLSKTILGGGSAPYAAARDVAMLHGLEAAGHSGAIFMKEIAKRHNEPEWVNAIDESIARAADHMRYLQEQAEILGRASST